MVVGQSQMGGRGGQGQGHRRGRVCVVSLVSAALSCLPFVHACAAGVCGRRRDLRPANNTGWACPSPGGEEPHTTTRHEKKATVIKSAGPRHVPSPQSTHTSWACKHYNNIKGSQNVHSFSHCSTSLAFHRPASVASSAGALERCFTPCPRRRRSKPQPASRHVFGERALRLWPDPGCVRDLVCPRAGGPFWGGGGRIWMEASASSSLGDDASTSRCARHEGV